MMSSDTAPTTTRLPRLSRDFHLLWAGETVGHVGDRVTMFVIPALMVFVLGSSAFEIGLVSMAQYVAIPVLSLVAGALVDRWDLRALLIVCDLVRFAAVTLIPVAYWLGFLSVPLLFICVAVISAATVFFTLGYVPAVSSIVAASDLVRANARLEGSRTVSEVGGPAVAGLLYQLMSAAALLVGAVSYLFSAAMFRAMRPFGVKAAKSEPIKARLALGIRLNWTDPVLRRSTAGTLLANIGGPIFVTQMPVLAYQGLGLSAGLFGTVMSIAALGAVLGAVLAPKVSRKLGSGRMLGLSMVAHSAAGLGILAVPRFSAAFVLCATLTLYGFFFAWYNINSQSVRQARVPVADQAVIHGAYRTVTWGVIPISAFVGGIVVSSLAGDLGILNAAKYTMLAATVIGISSIIPLAGMQRLLDDAAPMVGTGASRPDGAGEPAQPPDDAAGPSPESRPAEAGPNLVTTS
ncbi:MAG TPA: MFS transporter [Micromonosporaceae bacterium]